MPRLSLDTQFGHLTISEEDGKIVAVQWGGRAKGKATPALLEAKRQLLEYFARRRRQFELPFKIDGTPMEMGVWRLLAEIPFGETRSYGELGRALALAPRAVGRACGTESPADPHSLSPRDRQGW